MNRHVVEIEETVLREGRELSLDEAARRAAEKLFTQVAAYLGDGVQYPREATIAYSWCQQTVDAEHETWVARAEIALHPPGQVVENPHAVPMDNQINEQVRS
jgi:hypothetical protein